MTWALGQVAAAPPKGNGLVQWSLDSMSQTLRLSEQCWGGLNVDASRLACPSSWMTIASTNSFHFGKTGLLSISWIRIQKLLGFGFPESSGQAVGSSFVFDFLWWCCSPLNLFWIFHRFYVEFWEALGRIRAAVDKHGDGPRTKWKFLGRDVCVSAWKKLHGLGCLTNNIAQKRVELGVNKSVIFIFLFLYSIQFSRFAT